MALVRPDKYPRYADQDIVDGTSGKNNVVEPSESKKNLGHGPLGAYPPRQYQNWLQRYIYNWIKFLDGEQVTVGPFAVEIPVSDLTVQQLFDIEWTITKDIVAIWFPTVLGTSNSTSLEVIPIDNGGVWPTEIVSGPAVRQRIPILLFDGTGGDKIGIAELPRLNSQSIQFYYPTTTGSIGNNFANSGSKGLLNATVVLKRDYT